MHDHSFQLTQASDCCADYRQVFQRNSSKTKTLASSSTTLSASIATRPWMPMLTRQWCPPGAPPGPFQPTPGLRPRPLQSPIDRVGFDWLTQAAGSTALFQKMLPKSRGRPRRPSLQREGRRPRPLRRPPWRAFLHPRPRWPALCNRLLLWTATPLCCRVFEMGPLLRWVFVVFGEFL